ITAYNLHHVLSPDRHPLSLHDALPICQRVGCDEASVTRELTMSNIYGEWLKAQREAAGLTQQELATAAVMTRSHIAHIEAGRRTPSKEDARRLDRALNTGDVLSSFLPDDDGVVAKHFEAAHALEQQAVEIREFALSFVPGILQTEGYARAVL